MSSNMISKFVAMAIFILASVHRSFARSGICYLRKSQTPMGYRVATPTVPLSASIPNECSTACSNSTTLLDSCFQPSCLCLIPNGRDLQTCVNCLYNMSSSTTLGDNYNMVQAAFDEFADACFGYPVAQLSLVNQTIPTSSSSSSLFPTGTSNATSTSVRASGTSNGTSISANSNSTSSTAFSTTTALSSATRSAFSTTTTLSSATRSASSTYSVTATGRPATVRSAKQRCRLKK